jgi:hypothetical protein
MYRLLLCLPALASAPLAATAQSRPLRRAAETIAQADVSRRVHLIAHDSMGGRDTPSPGLEKTAAYIAAEFRRMGLKPLGDSGTWLQRYGIRVREVDTAGSSLGYAEAGAERMTLRLGPDVKLMFGAPRTEQLTVPLVLIGGAPGDGATLDPAAMRGHALIWLAPPGAPQRMVTQILRLGIDAGAAFLIVSIPDDSTFAARSMPRGEIVTADEVGWPFVMLQRESAVLAQFPDAAQQLAEVRAAATLVAVPVPEWTVSVRTRFRRDEALRVPNVVGLVEGRDPALRGEYVVVSAHFDHVGSRCRGADGPDKICNGADDNASGTTGLLELAEAFARPGARPARSLIFVAVSGEERGLWGSEYFALRPPVAIDRMVANLNMDHLGRNWRDSIVVIGTEHSDLGQPVSDVALAHPELKVAPLPDQWPAEQIYFRSDHYNFARQGVPILFFTNGFHSDYHAVTDSPDKIDAEKAARVIRFIFYIAHSIANAPERPRWKPESYQAIVKRKPIS